MQARQRTSAIGEAFALVALAIVDAKGRTSDLDREADRYRYSHPEVNAYLKAAVSAGTTTDANFGGPLSQYRAIADISYPPPSLVRANRLNDKGSPCFYAASSANTAIAEIQVKEGDFVHVAGFCVKPELFLRH